MQSSIRIIGIAGKQGSGKDTVADVFVREAQYVKVGYADALKVLVHDMFDIPKDVLWGPSEKRDTRTRTILQELGTDFARKHDPNIWIRLFNRHIENNYWPQRSDIYYYIVVPDVRFPNEAQNLKDNYATHLIRVKRPDTEYTKDPSTCNHASETSVDTIPDNLFDFTVHNTGTKEELQKIVHTIIGLVQWN